MKEPKATGQYSKGKFVCSHVNGTYKLKLMDSQGSVVVLHINQAGQVFGLVANKTSKNKKGT